ncbi:DoxX-like family protein [Conchiformibius kuhniae]|uniref:DoxX-like family protein n=1 Tax=Conchiformibius kuhniae TaxID=211502 RepID=A0A8T9MRE2_9NEIS|nr:DoxX-like family protein [Conchiformibius kuhniae]UOP04137.1 DoxX-like family protein [Conchiformibius kuhniae]
MKRDIPFYLPASVGLLWLWSGAVSLWVSPHISLALLAETGVAAAWREPLLYAAAGLDMLLGILCLGKLRRCPMFWLAQAATVAAYSAVMALRLPEYALHPFAPLLKNLPIAALMLFLFRETGKES